MIAGRWSVSRSFLLAAARLRGLHLDSSGAARRKTAATRKPKSWAG